MISTITSAVTTVFNAFIGMVQTVGIYIVGGTIGSGDTATTVSANPVLLFFLVLPLVGIGIGLFKRLISVR